MIYIFEKQKDLEQFIKKELKFQLKKQNKFCVYSFVSGSVDFTDNSRTHYCAFFENETIPDKLIVINCVCIFLKSRYK